MDAVWTVVVAAIMGGFAAWGLAAPAIDLQRRRELRARVLLASYGRHIRLIPRAIGRSTWGGLRHPWKWDGPTGGHVVLVVFCLLMALVGTVNFIARADRSGALAWTPLFLITGVGLGILLVRETAGLDDGGQPGPTSPPAKHRT
jgi:hypothetical protein